MGFMDKLKRQASGLKDKATDVVDKHGDQIHTGLDKAGDVVDKRTKGKYTDKIDSAQKATEQGLDKLDGKQDDFNRDPKRHDPT